MGPVGAGETPPGTSARVSRLSPETKGRRRGSRRVSRSAAYHRGMRRLETNDMLTGVAMKSAEELEQRRFRKGFE